MLLYNLQTRLHVRIVIAVVVHLFGGDKLEIVWNRHECLFVEGQRRRDDAELNSA